MSTLVTPKFENPARASLWSLAVTDRINGVLYEDVLTILDAAIGADPANLHARALSAHILMLKAYEGDGVYDVCRLLDARDDAEYVVTRSKAAATLTEIAPWLPNER